MCWWMRSRTVIGNRKIVDFVMSAVTHLILIVVVPVHISTYFFQTRFYFASHLVVCLVIIRLSVIGYRCAVTARI